MFNLIKWIACGLFAYFVYDLLTTIHRQKATPLALPHRDRASNFTGGTGKGMSVPVEDANGAHRTAKVGRGVVS